MCSNSFPFVKPSIILTSATIIIEKYTNGPLNLFQFKFYKEHISLRYVSNMLIGKI